MLFDPKTMNYEPGWSLQPEKCNCDMEFIDLIKDRQHNRTIFHMGTGLHHQVGLELAGTNDIIGLTLSPAELMSYTDLCKTDPALPNSYTILFGDIATINWSILPVFDIITLFHYGEILVDEKLFQLENYRIKYLLAHTLPRRLADSGRILTYRNSVAFPMVQPLFDTYLTQVDEYKSLNIYKKKD